MKLETKQVIFWIVCISLIILFMAFGFISTWTAYSQMMQGIGQEPNILGYIGWCIFSNGGNK